MRYLYKADDDKPFAYAPGRRDFFRSGDDVLFAHDSHGWLVAAASGETLAHRTGDIYYAPDGERLYRVSSETDARVPDSDSSAGPDSTADDAKPPRRATTRVARPRR